MFGAQAFVYHGSMAGPEELIPALLNDTFSPGQGAGSMYGRGLYTVYDLSTGVTAAGRYGPYLYKLKVNLYGCISFDSDTTKLIYKKDMTPAQQAKFLGLDDRYVQKLKELGTPKGALTSEVALKASKFLSNAVKGIIYTGANDGKCALIYDASIAVPVAWKMTSDKRWYNVDRESLRSALSKSVSDEWQKEKYEMSEFAKEDKLIKDLKGMANLPVDQRVVNEDLNVDPRIAEALPPNLKVYGRLKIENCTIKQLPPGLVTMNGIKVVNASVQSLPPDILIQGPLIISEGYVPLPDNFQLESLSIKGSKMDKLPSNLKVKGAVEISYSSISSISPGFQAGDLHLVDCPNLTKLPDGMVIESEMSLVNTGITRLPRNLHVGAGLYIPQNPISELPEGLYVGRNLNLGNSPVSTELPNNIVVKGEIRHHTGEVMKKLNAALRSKSGVKESHSTLHSLVKEILTQM